MTWLRRLRACLLAGGLGAAMLVAAQPAPTVHVLQVHDAIGPASADYIVRGLRKAQEAGAALVVLELDTPGGLDTSMRQIIQAILASSVPVATWVAPSGARAASAGTYILYASHVAAMAPSTTLGAATPVAIGMPGGGGDAPSPARPASAPASAPPASAPQADAMTAKQVNDAAAFIRGLAQQRGRNAEWAERAVREAVSLTAAEAERERVIDVVARDLPELLDRIDGRSVRTPAGEVTLRTRGAETKRVLPGWRHQLLSVIASPSLALILMMLGIYGLLFEFSSPGFGVAGVVGAICLLLALFALQMLPINYAGLALLALGVALMAAEAVSPTFGVLGVGGLVAFVAGGVLLFDDDVPGYGVPLPLLLGMAALSALLIVGGGTMALRARRRPLDSGALQMVGAFGEVLEHDADGAWVRVHGERWRARAGVPLAAGQRVRVTGLAGLTLQVEPVAADGGTLRQGASP
jgi:membrane-bound serine protease (ClpP class)